MAESIVTAITDDIDGSADARPLRFSIEGRSYRIDLSDRNRTRFLKDLDKWVQAARRDREGGTAPARRNTRPVRAGGKTLFSRLKPEEKERFRRWGVRRKLTTKTARRIADSAVQAWIDAGRP